MIMRVNPALLLIILSWLYQHARTQQNINPPTIVRATLLTPRSVQVAWTPPSSLSDVTGYLISYTTTASYTSGGSMMVSGNSAARGILSNLEEGTTYTITVQSNSNDGFSIDSNAVTVTTYTAAPSSPPQNFMVTSFNPASLMVSWQPPPPIHHNGLITGYVIQYSRNDGSSDSMTMTVSSGTRQDTISGLVAYVDYSVTMAAMNANGTGLFSNLVEVRSGEDSLIPPINVKATLLTPRSIQVTWTLSLSSSYVTGYLISYTTDASYISVNNRSRSMPVGNTTTGILIDLEEGTTYIITVQATASNNVRSGNSSAVTVTTYTAAPSSPPQNVMVMSVDPASLMVSWQPPPPIDHNGPITGYVIQYTRVGPSGMMSVNVTSGTAKLISRLFAYVDHSVTVAAMNVNGTGPFSNSVIDRSGENRPSAPQQLNIISVNSSSVMLRWEPPATPNGVIILYSLKYNSTTLIVTNTSGDVLMYTVGGLSSENVYIFQVTAHTRAGEGPHMNITVVIPPTLITDVTISYDTVTSSSLTLNWMMINLTNSVLIYYTVFYLPVSDPYGPIIASNRRKRQLAQAGELVMNFIGTTGTLTGLNGSVTYNIQVAAVVMLNGQVVTGDRSTVTVITTLEGVPSAPRNLNYTNLTTSGITLTWSRPDPPNGLITQYNISYSVTSSQCEIFYNFTILPVIDSGESILSYTWIELIQGKYQFSVEASTGTGPGESASLMLSILPSNKGSSDGGSDDNNGAIIALATLFAIAVIGLIISVVINVFVIAKLKQSRYDVDQSNVMYSDVKQSVSGDHTIKEPINKHTELSEPEYEAIDTKPNMKTYNDVKMDANPAYQTTS